jgi:uncharacterized alkaline shock family protein YloU
MNWKLYLTENKSDGMSVEDIAKKHSVSVDLIRSQLAKGIKVETEHTDDLSVATQIAMDHLVERPMYYDDLEDMEAENIKAMPIPKGCQSFQPATIEEY